MNQQVRDYVLGLFHGSIKALDYVIVSVFGALITERGLSPYLDVQEGTPDTIMPFEFTPLTIILIIILVVAISIKAHFYAKARATERQKERDDPFYRLIKDAHQVRKGEYKTVLSKTAPLRDLFAYATKSITVIQVSSTILTPKGKPSIESAIVDGVTITMIMLHPKSSYIPAYQEFTRATELEERISTNLKTLCGIKRDSKGKINLNIKLHDEPLLRHGLILIDHGLNRAVMQIVDYSDRAQEDWDVRILVQSEDRKPYDENLALVPYEELMKLSDYQCPTA